MSDDSEEKTEPPTKRKLDDARKKGQIAQSRDIVTVTLTVTISAYLWFSSGLISDRLSGLFVTMGRLSEEPLRAVIGEALREVMLVGIAIVAPAVILIVLVVIVTSRETASLPPALRVHTDAAARVQGTEAAISSPYFRSTCNCTGNSRSPNRGTTRILTVKPVITGHGARRAAASFSPFRLSDINVVMIAVVTRGSTNDVMPRAQAGRAKGIWASSRSA